MSLKAKKLLHEINEEFKETEDKNFMCTHSNGK